MIQGILTTISLLTFIAIVIWAFSKDKKDDFEQAANLPFADESIDKHEPRQGGNHG